MKLLRIAFATTLGGGLPRCSARRYAQTTIRASRSPSLPRSAPAAPATPSPACSPSRSAWRSSRASSSRRGPAPTARSRRCMSRVAGRRLHDVVDHQLAALRRAVPDEEHRLRSGEGFQPGHPVRQLHADAGASIPSIPAKSVKELIDYGQGQSRQAHLRQRQQRRHRRRRDAQALGQARHAARALQEHAAGASMT